jgi:hypothetical protein
MRERPAILTRHSLKETLRGLRRTWKKSRRYRPGRRRFSFYQYLDAVYKFYAELRKTKGAENRARDTIVKKSGRCSNSKMHAINAIINASSAEDARTVSRWAQALRYAWKWRDERGTMPLRKFFELNGGVAGCATKLANHESPILKKPKNNGVPRSLKNRP